MAKYVEWLVLNSRGSARSNLAVGDNGGVPVEIVGGSLPAPSRLLVQIVAFGADVAVPAGVPTPLLALTPVPGGKAYTTHRFAVINTGSNPVTINGETSTDGVTVDADPDNVRSMVLAPGEALPLEFSASPSAPYWGLEATSAGGTTVKWAWFAAQ